MDAVKLLMEDHRRVEDLIARFESLHERAAKVKIVQELSQELNLHAQEEETIFYPAFRSAAKDEGMVQHALEEHQEVKDLLNSLTDELSDQELTSKIMELKQLLQDHVQEEEEEMFPKAREALGDSELERLGDRIDQSKPQLMEKLPPLKITMAPESKVEERQNR